MKSYLLFTCLLLTACSSTKLDLETQAPALESAVPGTTVSGDNTESVRHSEQLKAYPVARYQDPADPNVMHEAHTMYRAEESPRWNLSPNAPIAVPLGPTVAVADPAKQTAVLSGELEQKIQQQNQLLQTTYEQNSRMDEEIKKMQAETRQVIEADTRLQQELADRKAELQKIKNREAAATEAERKKAALPLWKKVWLYFYPQQ